MKLLTRETSVAEKADDFATPWTRRPSWSWVKGLPPASELTRYVDQLNRAIVDVAASHGAVVYDLAADSTTDSKGSPSPCRLAAGGTPPRLSGLRLSVMLPPVVPYTAKVVPVPLSTSPFPETKRITSADPSLVGVLTDATEQALESGRRLKAWWNSKLQAESLSLFELRKPAGHLASMQAFYDRIEPEGDSIMGCLQSAEFTLGADLDAARRFVERIPRRFAQRCCWPRAGGSAGGFGYTPLLVRRAGAASPELPSSREIDFSMDRLEWQVLRVDIHDFVRAMPGARPVAGILRRVIREAALVVVTRDLSDPVGPAPPDSIAEASFGYGFLPIAPEPNLFGFGPGHFEGAFKQFRFLLDGSGRLEVRLAFMISPRSEKILNLRGHDPVYATVAAIDALTLRRGRLKRSFHDRMDAAMLRIHGTVHHSLLVDLMPFWDEAARETA